MNVIRLSEIDPEAISLVGGKAAGLARLIAVGQRVPDGFCLTTEAFDTAEFGADSPVGQEVAAAYAELGDDVSVAVRSSATAEDLPWASFAGLQDTVLEVTGAEDVCAAITTCWASLDSERAVAYRRSHGVERAAMAVVVQRMVQPSAAGVVFTANPITGRRTEMVVDAAPGLGTAVVDGRTSTDHYVLGVDGADSGDSLREGTAGSISHGCLDADQLSQLQTVGAHIQSALGSPQDIEWAFDSQGELWLLQSRAITSLFPTPESHDDGAHVYMEAGHMQGMLRPFTPMGESVMDQVTRQWSEAFGARPGSGSSMIAYIGGRMYIDLTSFVRSALMRRRLPKAMAMYGPRVSRALEHVCRDPRFAPRRGLPFSLGNVGRVARKIGPPMILGTISALRHPQRERKRSASAIAEARRESHAPQEEMSADQRLEFAESVHLGMLTGPMMASLNPLWAAMACQQLATRMLRGIADESDIAAVMRGAPGNVTTEMDLKLWVLATNAREHRRLLTETPTNKLVDLYRSGDLPEIGLREFLTEYGHRAAAEIDIGVPRWDEDPGPIFDAIAGYLLLDDPEQAPDGRFARAAAEARAALERIVADVARRPMSVRARVVGFLLHRARTLIGLRELPKFLWLFPLRLIRRQLLAIGAELVDRGLLEIAEDIMFLDLDEVRTVLHTAEDPRPRIRARKEDYAREMRRRHVPGLLLSDGTDVEAALPISDTADGMKGTGAAPGVATGRARVITDPVGARIEPGEILVAPTTDPGWTPLFLTAAGLVSETGSPMAHGPTVAREYGIPAVICIREATSAISTGDLITIDGAAGTVDVAEPQAQPTSMPTSECMRAGRW